MHGALGIVGIVFPGRRKCLSDSRDASLPVASSSPRRNGTPSCAAIDCAWVTAGMRSMQGGARKNIHIIQIYIAHLPRRLRHASSLFCSKVHIPKFFILSYIYIKCIVLFIRQIRRVASTAKTHGARRLWRFGRGRSRGGIPVLIAEALPGEARRMVGKDRDFRAGRRRDVKAAASSSREKVRIRLW